MNNMKRLLNVVQDCESLQHYAKQHQLDVLILDTLSRVHVEDENSNQSMGRVMNTFNALQIELGLSIIVVHHETKSAGKGDHLKALRGAGRIGSDAQVAMRLIKTAADMRRLVVAKSNWTAQAQPFVLRVREDGTLEHGTTATTRERVFEAVHTHPGEIREKIAALAGCSPAQAGKYLKEFTDSGKIRADTVDRAFHYYLVE